MGRRRRRLDFLFIANGISFGAKTRLDSQRILGVTMSVLDRFRSIVGAKPDETDAELAPGARLKERRKRKRVNAREGTRVLIIDDSPTIVAVLRKFLHSAKHEVFEANDAETGIEIARKHQPELVFLDIILPGMSGFAALRKMRREPATMGVPIIMISGNEEATEQFYANRIGADDFMKKPFSRYEVFVRIEQLLDEDRVPRRRANAD